MTDAMITEMTVETVVTVVKFLTLAKGYILGI